jgi:hypothetical protein
MGHEQGVFARRFIFCLPKIPLCFEGFFVFFFAKDEFISKGENDMKRNKRPSREEFLGRRKSGFVRIYAGWKMERLKMETQKRRKTMKAKNRN